MLIYDIFLYIRNIFFVNKNIRISPSNEDKNNNCSILNSKKCSNVSCSICFVISSKKNLSCKSNASSSDMSSSKNSKKSSYSSLSLFSNFLNSNSEDYEDDYYYDNIINYTNTYDSDRRVYNDYKKYDFLKNT